MATSRTTPVIVGVGDIINRSLKTEDAIEPLDLMKAAILNAIKDTEATPAQQERIQSSIDSLAVVQTWTWPYADLPSLLSSALGCTPQYNEVSDHGGNKPAKMFDEAAKRIARGESDIAVVVGGEALASLSACAAAKQLPPKGWTKPAENITGIFSPTTRDLGENLGAIHSIGAPIHVYPLFEAGFRAHRMQTPTANTSESAALYADFAKVASQNSKAWSFGKPAATEEVIGTVSKRNRMICSPYPLLMNAFNTVNLAGACLLMSVQRARELGVAEERWVYPLGGAGTRDSIEFWERPDFHSSPALGRSLDAALEVSRLRASEVDMFDFYSCFPIVPKLACEHLGLPMVGGEKEITLLGGLTSFGGAGNNYSMHALVEMTRRLREVEDGKGLVLANGGVLTYHHVVCLGSKPRRDGGLYPQSSGLPDMITDVAVPKVDSRAEGDAVIETYTVEWNKDGTPLRGHIVGRLKSNGHRFLANHGDDATLRQLSSMTNEQIGREGRAFADGRKKERNLFVFAADSRL